MLAASGVLFRVRIEIIVEVHPIHVVTLDHVQITRKRIILHRGFTRIEPLRYSPYLRTRLRLGLADVRGAGDGAAGFDDARERD